MSYHAADGAALVAAAVQAAIRERAPKRTVAAVAAAVAGMVLSAAVRPPPTTKPKERNAQDAAYDPAEADDPAKLLASLRAVRSAQRIRKKMRRREAKQAANSQLSHLGTSQLGAETPQIDGTAGHSAEHVGASAAALALVPDEASPPRDSSTQEKKRPKKDPSSRIDASVCAAMGITVDAGSSVAATSEFGSHAAGHRSRSPSSLRSTIDRGRR